MSNCATCKWYRQWNTEHPEYGGQCFALPPVPVLEPRPDGYGGWQMEIKQHRGHVYPTDGCSLYAAKAALEVKP